MFVCVVRFILDGVAIVEPLSVSVLGVVLVAVGLIVWRRFEFSNEVEMANQESVVMPVGDEAFRYSSIVPMSDLAIEGVRLRVAMAHRELEQAQQALCNMLGVSPGDGSQHAELVFECVRNDGNWAALHGEYNLRRYGSRWGDSTRRASAGV